MEYSTTVSKNQPIAITIGNFDGIHRGHQRLLHELRVTAQELNCVPVLITFSPHTLLVIRPNIDLQCLTTLEEKLSLARTYGHVAESIVISFTPEVALLSAEDFLEHLRTHFSLQAIVVGENFSLGHNRKGNISFLQHYGQEHGILVRPIPLVEENQQRISSTRIRTLVSEGNIPAANELLGHPVVVSGIVVSGDKRGRQLGFPTANLVPQAHKLIPVNGIYAAYVRVENEIRTYKSAVSIGVRPTFNGQRRLVEAYLLDVELDLYDKRITIDFIARLRNEERFDSIEALIVQMAADVQVSRQLLKEGG